MKTPQEAALGLVLPDVVEQVFKGAGAHCSAAEDSLQDDYAYAGLPDDWSGDEDAADMELGPDAPLKAEAAAETLPARLLPWEAPEVQSREWLNLFCQNKDRNGRLTKKQVVDFTPGSGTAATAACLLGHPYLGFAHNQVHKDVILQTVVLRVVPELILNRRDGFEQSRFLSRARSLGGGGGQSDGEAATCSTPAKTPGASPPFDSEGSSSSSSSSAKPRRPRRPTLPLWTEGCLI